MLDNASQEGRPPEHARKTHADPSACRPCPTVTYLSYEKLDCPISWLLCPGGPFLKFISAAPNDQAVHKNLRWGVTEPRTKILARN